MTLSCDPNLRGQRSKYFKLCYFLKHYFSYRLSSMAMRLMYIHELETIYRMFWSKDQLGVIWGHRVDYRCHSTVLRSVYRSSLAISFFLSFQCTSGLLKNAASAKRFSRFQPNLVRRTADPSFIWGIHRLGSKVT